MKHIVSLVFTGVVIPYGAAAQEVQNFTQEEMFAILNNVGDFIFAIGSLLVVVAVIIGAWFFMMGGGNPDNVSKGKTILLWAAIGTVVILVAKGVPAVVGNLLGVSVP